MNSTESSRLVEVDGAPGSSLLISKERNPSESRNEVIPVDWHGKSRGASAFGPRRGSHSMVRFSLSSSNFSGIEEANDFQCCDAMHACIPPGRNIFVTIVIQSVSPNVPRNSVRVRKPGIISKIDSSCSETSA